MAITASRRFAARLIPVVLFLMSCVDAPSTPEGSSTPGASFIVAPVFSLVGPTGSGPLTAPQSSALDDAFDLVDNFRMVVIRIPSGQFALDTIIPVTPGQDEYDLSVTLTVNGASEQFSVVLTAFQGTLELFTADPITVTATPDAAPNAPPPTPVDVTLRYSGPGATATSMVVSPAQVVLAPDGTVQLSATVLDDSGVAIADVPLAWSSASAAVASVSLTGLATATGQGLTEVVVSTPTGLEAKSWVYVVGGTLAYVQDGVVNVRAPAGGDAQAKSSGGAASGPTWAGDDLYYAEGGVVQKAGSATTLLHASWPSVSPDGGLIAGDAGGTLVFANIDGTNETEGPSGTTPIWTDWSTLVVGGGSIQQVEADGSARSTLVSGDASLPAFSSSGTLAYVSGGKLMVQGRADALADVGGRPSWSPDGAWIVAPGGGGLLLIPADGAAPPVALPGLDGASDPAWQGTSFGGGSPPALSLTRLDPDPAIPGQEVSIVGTGFDWIIPKNNKVFWPGADGSITGEVLSVSTTALRSIMPRGVVAGQIRVENRQGQALLEFVPRLGSIEIHAKTPWDAAVGGVGIKILDSTGTEVAAGSTDQDGTYAADALFPGTYTINITAPTGFTLTGDASRALTITAAVSTLDLTLRPAVAKVTISPADLTLGVFDEVGVSVTPLDINGDVVPDIGSISWSGSARLDAWDGGLNTTIVGRQPSAKARDAGFSVTLDGKSFGFAATVTSSIGGTVIKDEDKSPVQKLAVALLQGDKELAHTSTDNAGRYSFGGLMAGTYTVTPGTSSEGAVSPASTSVTLGSSNPIGKANFSVGAAGGLARNFKALLLSGGHSNNNADIQAAFASRWPDIQFDEVYANSTTPSVATLAQYKVVLVFENGLFSNSTSVGNALAQYVQAGGNVVFGTFYWQDRSDNPKYYQAGWGQLENYDPFLAPEGSEYAADSLNVSTLVPHALTTDVTTLHVDSYQGGVAAKGDATVVAWWADGTPFIGYRTESQGQRLVGVSTAPGYASFGGWSGDFYQIWENALRFAAAGSTPVPPPPSQIIVKPLINLKPLHPVQRADRVLPPSGSRGR